MFNFFTLEANSKHELVGACRSLTFDAAKVDRRQHVDVRSIDECDQYFRCSLVVCSQDDIDNALMALEEGEFEMHEAPNLFLSFGVVSAKRHRRHRLALICSGLGTVLDGRLHEISQWSEPFQSEMQSWERLFYTPDLSRLELLQFRLCAMQHAFVLIVCQQYGLKVNAVLGFSAGEISAAFLAGVLCQSSAGRLALAMGRVHNEASSVGGRMHIVFGIDRAQLERLCARCGDPLRIAIGAQLAPRGWAVTGFNEEMERITAALDSMADQPGLTHMYPSSDFSVPFHFAGVFQDSLGMAKQFSQALQNDSIDSVYSSYHSNPLPCFMAQTGAQVDVAAFRTGKYWASSVSGESRNQPAVEAALDDGISLFLELNTKPLYARSAQDALAARTSTEGLAVCVCDVAEKDQDVPTPFHVLKALAKLWCAGANFH